MPHHKSAAKRVKTNKRDQNRYTTVRSQLKTMLKKVSQDMDNKALMSETVSNLDRAAKKGVVPKSVANRRKSRLARAANRVKRAS